MKKKKLKPQMAFPNTIFDQLGRKIFLEKSPGKIVSLVPSQTELLVDLGLSDQIVGITKFCVHPKGLRKEKTVVGGTKKVKFDRISALQPDLIICNKEENTAEMVVELEKIAPVHVSDIASLKDCLELIRQYGELFEVEERALELASKIEFLAADFQKEIRNLPQRKVAYFIWKKPWMLAGKDTFIDHLLEMNGFKNVISEDSSRYPEIDLEDLKKVAVDLVLLSSEPYPFKEEDKTYFSGIVEKEKIILVDGEYFSWYGSRLIKAFDYFRSLHSRGLPN